MAPDDPPLAASARSTWVLVGGATLLAALTLVPGFRAHGLWSTGEIAVLQRAQAALGAALGGLERAAVLPDLLRTQAVALTGDPAAIRLPGALASALLVGLAVLLARRLGASPRFALLAGAFALATPLLQSQARLALGDPIGELTATTAALLGAAALTHPRRRPAILLTLATLLALGLGLLSAGLLLGVLLPLVAITIAWPQGHVRPTMSRGPDDLSQETPTLPTDLSRETPNLRADLSRETPTRPRWLAALLALTILAVIALIAVLAYSQGNGWIAALAAARDLPLAERPYTRPFTATFEEFSDQIFPWLPLLVVGLLRPGRARWPALWLLAGLVLVSAWSLRYGPQAVPLTVPAAVLCSAAAEHLLSARTATRRLGLLLVVAGGLILAKDVRRTPSKVGAVLVHGKGEHSYPARELDAQDTLAGFATFAMLGLLLAVLTRRPTTPATSPTALTRSERLRARLPAALPLGILFAVLAHQAVRYGHGLLPRTSEALSLHRPLTRYAAWQQAGELTAPLLIHRVNDPGLALYGPPETARSAVPSRDAIIQQFKTSTASAALLRTSELAALHQQARADGWPLYVPDASNRDVVLVSNVLPAGATDENPIRRVLFDTAPVLAHTTLVRFEDHVEIVGWAWHEPIVRGRETTLEIALHVLQPLPSGSKIYVRLQQGKLSRINPAPHELAEGLYPPHQWRAGDYILHRFTVPVPMLEILPGTYEVVVGLRRTESKNFTISAPADDHNDHGVRFHGPVHELATVGEVQVW